MIESNWIAEVKARGLGGALDVLLDVLEPLGPLGAQLLWVAQPVSGLAGASEAIGKIAQALEEPGGVEQIRQQLHDEP
jgi:hypothetical protein